MHEVLGVVCRLIPVGFCYVSRLVLESHCSIVLPDTEDS